MIKIRLLEYANQKGDKGIQSITDKQLVMDLSALFPLDFFFQSKQLTIKKMAALILMDMVEPVCETCGCSVSDRFPWKTKQTTPERITPYGAWARTCSASCNQQLIEKEGKRKQSFIDKFGTDNPMKNPSISKKSIDNRQTDWEKVGIAQQKRRLIERGVSPDVIDSIDFSSDESKSNYLISVGNRLTQILGREPTRQEIANETGIHYVMIHRWLSGTDAFISSRGVSSAQLEVKEFIQSLGVDDVITSDRTLIKPLEIDILIPSAKLGIEYDGIWNHCEYYKPDKRVHLNKTELVESLGYRLIHIFDCEWIDPIKKEIWKSIIRHKLGMTPNRIPARKTKIELVSSKEAEQFFESNHLQGHVKTSNYVGLYHKGELVQLISFGKSRFDDSTEIIRMATLKNTVVVGGVSKLFSYVKAHSNHLTCFADRRYASRNDCGYSSVMTPCEPTEVNWWAFSAKEYYLQSRFGFMKHKLSKKLTKFDSSKTAVENLYANGYDRIWDCGNLKFEWRK